MSIAAVKHFLDKVYSDQDLMSVFETHKDSSYDEKLALSLERGADLGFDFTAEEFTEVDQIKRFWEKVEEDDALRTRVHDIGSGSEPREAVSGVVELAASEGFTFSTEGIIALSQLQVLEDAAEELTAGDLETVVGGLDLQTSGSLDNTASLLDVMSSPLRPGTLSSYRTVMCPW